MNYSVSEEVRSPSYDEDAYVSNLVLVLFIPFSVLYPPSPPPIHSAFQPIHAVFLLGKNCLTCDCVLYIFQDVIRCCFSLWFPVQISTVGKLLLTVNFTCLALDWKELTTSASVSWCISLVGWGEDGNKPGLADVVPTGEAEEGGVHCGSKAGASAWSFPRCRL